MSTIRGYWQAPALTTVAIAALALALAGTALPNRLGQALSVGAVIAIVATPVLRILWLIFRWWQERDRRFIAIGVCLLFVTATGALLAGAEAWT